MPQKKLNLSDVDRVLRTFEAIPLCTKTFLTASLSTSIPIHNLDRILEELVAGEVIIRCDARARPGGRGGEVYVLSDALDMTFQQWAEEHSDDS